MGFHYGIKSSIHDQEGRVITLEFDTFYLVAVYVPNSGGELLRLDYRVNEWDKSFFKYLNELKSRKDVMITGDLNVAHREIDIYDPVGKLRQPGFTIEERSSFQGLLDSGFIDTFRNINPNKVYTNYIIIF
jgi:exodeoxyribonuclease III